MNNIREIDVGVNIHFKVACDEHKHIGNLPCPWPDCKRGIAENEFIAVSHIVFSAINKDFSTHYKRREWSSIDGIKRYSWDEPNFPALLRTNNLLREENLRVGLDETDYSNKQIYHYTNIQGLLGILNSEALWMTDFQYMNDLQEINHGIQLAKSVLEELKNSKKHSGKEEYFKIWENFVEIGVDRRICISCFSLDDGDSLSQWRGYGDKGVGISIGFDVSAFEFWDRNLVTLNPIVYDTEQQRKILSNFFHIYMTILDWDADKNMTNMEGKKIETVKPEELTNYFISKLYGYIVSFKHPSFADEKEVRWVYVEDTHISEWMTLKAPKKLFRTIGNKLIPYISSKDLSDISNDEEKMKLSITEIVVGPQKDSDLVVSGIKELLQENGYAHVAVRKSTVPFRSH